MKRIKHTPGLSRICRWSLLAALAFVVAGPGAIGDAFADKASKNGKTSKEVTLKEQPLVRHRKLLVSKRLELTPTFESTINAEFKHTMGAGLKLEYHLSDVLSIGGVGIYGGSFNTGLSKKINRTLPAHGTVQPDDPDPTPTNQEWEGHLNKMPLHGAIFVSVTPWYGKLAAFGKAFVPFDFYFQGGISFAQLTNSCNNTVCNDMEVGVLDPDRNLPDNDPNDDPPLNDGFKPGLYLGGGIHVFLNDFIAIDFTVRNYLFSDNPSGLDFDADLQVEDEDRRILNHMFMGIGVSILLPLDVKRTN